MSSLRGSGDLPGSPPVPSGTGAGAHDDIEKLRKLKATGSAIIEALADDSAITFLAGLGLEESLIEKGLRAISQHTDQLPAQYVDDNGASNGYLGRTQEDGWCIFNADLTCVTRQ